MWACIYVCMSHVCIVYLSLTVCMYAVGMYIVIESLSDVCDILRIRTSLANIYHYAMYVFLQCKNLHVFHMYVVRP